MRFETGGLTAALTFQVESVVSGRKDGGPRALGDVVPGRRVDAVEAPSSAPGNARLAPSAP